MNFLLKVAMYTTVFQGAYLLLGGLNYSTWLVSAGVILFLATVGHFADQWILPRWGNILSTISGGLFMIAVIWGVQFVFPGSEVYFSVAVVIGVVLGIVEYQMHQELLAKGS
ncbi:DUF2512 family protein [Melghirimyces algeriensis]|uniref:4 TMS phage holin, superfamily IV n=1 Tax=Melghirimyces algeriensis TaxID=910412 RepID=A0A521E492_9BACL|nr:DUF2512 family protein [Melghirimyces algeriensis]SMO77990.1 Protein of unknown function [Melghirimyces algeriensis]